MTELTPEQLAQVVRSLAKAGQLDSLDAILGVQADAPIQAAPVAPVIATPMPEPVEETPQAPAPVEEVKTKRMDAQFGDARALARAILRRADGEPDIFASTRLDVDPFMARNMAALKDATSKARSLTRSAQTPPGMRGVGAALAFWDMTDRDPELSSRFARILAGRVTAISFEEREAIAPLLKGLSEIPAREGSERPNNAPRIYQLFMAAWSRLRQVA